MRVLLGVCGGIAAYKAAEVVRRLRERGAEVRVALTRSGASFLTPLTLEVLSGHRVYTEEYLTSGGPGHGEEEHIAAAAWADLLCIAPATTHTIARLALGLGDDFLSTVALAFDGPLVLAPAMHPVMWNRDSTQRHVATLRARGAVLAGPVEGPLASGEIGWGRMADPAVIVDAVFAATSTDRATGDKWSDRTVVVTAGPTHEPLDPVRFLGNRSSGKMGFALAAAAARQGARVVLIAGPVALPTPAGCRRIDVGTAIEMRDALYREAQDSDLVLMTAAVADFRPRRASERKIKRSAGVPVLELEANPDLLAGLRAVAPRPVLVGFSAETNDLEQNAVAKLAAKGADFLVVNDVSRSDIGFGADENEVTVHGHATRPLFLSRRAKAVLAQDLLDLFATFLESRERSLGAALDHR